ncbi:MAG: endonuclease/exonuclease/phosphatase family protein [Patescibacteria group bacterium]
MNVKIVNLNTWKGGNLLNKMLLFLKKEKPDILTLQEIYRGLKNNSNPKYKSLEIIQKTTGLKYLYFSAAYTTLKPDGKVEHGNAILSRWPIVHSKTIFYDIQYTENFTEPEKDFSTCPRTLQYIEILANGTKLNIFNTHGIWFPNNKDNKRRLNMGKIIVNEINGKQRVVLTGDFNVDRNTATMKYIQKELVDVFDGKLQTSFNMKQKFNPVLSNLVIDGIYVTPNIKVLKATCPNVNVSDHLPLITILEVK